MAKTNSEIEKEYQDTLKVSQSLLNGIQRTLETNAQILGQNTDAAKSWSSALMESLGDLNDEESLLKAINSLERQKTEWQSVASELGQEAVDNEKALLNVAQKSLQAELTKVQAINKVNDAAMELADNLNGGLDDFQSSIKNIPVLGNLLGSITKGPVNMLKSGVSNAAKTFVTDFGGALRGGATGMQALGTAGAGAGRALIAAFTGPQAIIAAIIIAAAAAVLGFYKMDAAAKAFREETGLLNSQTEGLQQNIANVTARTGALGASMEDVSKAAAAYSNEFGNIEQASEGVLTSVVTLNKNFGVGVGEAVKLNKVFQNIGGLSAEQAQYLVNQTAQMAKMAGVAPKQVMKDMAESSEYAYKYFQGSPKELAKAAVAAAKLGTSIAQAGKVADGLLDFQNSITSELEASAMLGVNLNFNQARYLAANGDILGSQQAILDEVQKNVDLTSLNVYEQEALAKATNMPLEDLKNQIRIREQFGPLAKEQLAAANALLSSGKDLSDITQADLNAQAEKMAAQEEMQSKFDSMGNKLKDIGNQILIFLAPIGELIFSIFEGFISPIINAVKGIFAAFDPIKQIMKDIFGEGAGIGGVFKFIGKLLAGPITFAINLFANGLKMVIGFVSGIWNIFKGIFTGDFSLILDGLLSIGEGILRFFYQIPMALFDTFFDMFPAIGEWFAGLFGKIKGWFMDLLPGWAQRLLGGGKSKSSEVQQQASQSPQGELTNNGSVDDGVIQGGNVVSTSPEDFLIASKNPGSLAESVGGGGVNISMDGVIAELQSLKNAFLSNKDVFIDRELVSRQISKGQEKNGRINDFGLSTT